jgi:hypothetical protein
MLECEGTNEWTEMVHDRRVWGLDFIMKLIAFWDLVSCGVALLNHRPDDGDSTHL